MSLTPRIEYRVPDETARVARAIFPKGNLYMGQAVWHWLTEDATCDHPKTAAACRRILKVEPALWTFAIHPEVAPTNTMAE